LRKLIRETSKHVFQRYPLLCDLDEELLLYRASMLIEMNDPGEVFTLYFTLQTPHQLGSIAHRLTSLRHLFFPYLKREQLKNLTEMLEMNEEDETMTSITLNRTADSPPLFQQTHLQLERAHFCREQEHMFQVTFVGEDGIDEGGLFREVITQMIHEIQSSLFIASPNSRNSQGQELYVPNPARGSPSDLRQFEFIGRLVGGALLSSTVLSGVSWPSLVWKSLLGEPLEEADYRQVDSLSFDSTEALLHIDENQIDSESFADIISLSFTTRTLDGQEVDLIPEGSLQPVTLANRHEYARLIAAYRQQELVPQLRALREGFQVETKQHCALFSWFLPSEVKNLLEGNKTIDLDLLKLHTDYSNCKEDWDIVRYLWNILESFDEEERRNFIKFTSGSPSLPSSWVHRRFTVFVTRSPPDFLPTAHTCSWRLDIPLYTSEESFRAKLLLSLASGEGFTFA